MNHFIDEETEVETFTILGCDPTCPNAKASGYRHIETIPKRGVGILGAGV